MLNELLMRGLFDLEIPPEQSDCWMTCLTRYTTTVGTELLSYVESLWETAEKDQKLQNNHTQKICELECKVLTQGRALEDHNNLLPLGAKGDVLTQYIASTLLVLGQ
jgi:hypothetical protein